MLLDQFAFLRPDWSALNLWNACISLVGLGAILALGLALDRPGAAAIAAGGAITVGFGAIMSFSRWRGAPLTLAAIGMAVCGAVGSLAGHSMVMLCACSALCAAITALATTISVGAWWIALQWAVALIVAGAYPADLEGALQRAALILGGAALQTLVALAAWVWRGPGEPLEPPIPLGPALQALKARLVERRHRGLFTFRAALTVVVATIVSHQVGVANGYWAPMTAIVVLKPRWRETWERGIGRILGTLIGASAATLAAVGIGHTPAAVAACVLLAGFAAVALQRVNYMAFTAALTAYIVYLLALLHTPPPMVALHRLAATLIGGLTALVMEGLFAPFNPWTGDG
jgi:hypothetical protein